jgi:hypothetical protein
MHPTKNGGITPAALITAMPQCGKCQQRAHVDCFLRCGQCPDVSHFTDNSI